MLSYKQHTTDDLELSNG